MRITVILVCKSFHLYIWWVHVYTPVVQLSLTDVYSIAMSVRVLLFPLRSKVLHT